MSRPSKQSVVCLLHQLSFLSLPDAQFCRAVCLQHWSFLSLISLLLLSKTNVCQELADFERLHKTPLYTSWEKRISEQNTSMLESAKWKKCSFYIHIPFFLPSCQMPQKCNLKVIGILWDSQHVF